MTPNPCIIGSCKVATRACLGPRASGRRHRGPGPYEAGAPSVIGKSIKITRAAIAGGGGVAREQGRRGQSGGGLPATGWSGASGGGEEEKARWAGLGRGGRGMRRPRPASLRASESPNCPSAANPRPAAFDCRPACRPLPLRDHPNPAHASAAPDARRTSPRPSCVPNFLVFRVSLSLRRWHKRLKVPLARRRGVTSSCRTQAWGTPRARVPKEGAAPRGQPDPKEGRAPTQGSAEGPSVRGRERRRA